MKWNSGSINKISVKMQMETRVYNKVHKNVYKSIKYIK